MKKFFALICILSISSLLLIAQTQVAEPAQEAIVPFRLFKTTNRWNFIELNTMTGQLYQIQYDINGDNRGMCILSDRNLAKNKKEVVGRFTLYSTENMWTFILLDQIDGGTWRVQWSFEENERFVIPICD